MVNVGIVGSGYWGSKHIRNFHEVPEANLTMVCDLDKKRLSQVQSLYPYVKTTSNFTDLLGNTVDAVVIATPVETHYQLTKEALLHDKHVLVEKPMTTSSIEAVELIELAENRKKVLMVGHTFIYNPAVDYLCKLVQSGELGDIYYINSARLNLGLIRPDVNVLWDLAPHDTSIVLYVLEKDPISVSARGARHIDSNVCDVAYLELRFPDETLVNIHVSWLDPCKVRLMTFVGSKKMAVYDDVSENEKVRIYDKGVAIDGDNGKLTTWPPSYRYGDVTIPFISNAEPLKIQTKDFLECIAKGRQPKSDGSIGLKVVRVLELANKSLINGGRRESLAVRNHLKNGSKQLAEVRKR
jgi:predicted dehydrogenase